MQRTVDICGSRCGYCGWLLSSHSTSASVSELSRLVTHTAVSSPNCNSEKRPLSNSVAFQTLFKWHRYCGILKIHIVRKINTGIRYEPVYRTALKELFPKVFTGLGKLEGAYKIKLKESTTPFALSVPRREPLPMMNKVKEELKGMENLGVKAPIKEATEWCSGVVVVPKPNGKIRICVELTHLNNNVCRERHILPAVDETLAKLPGATVFSKL